MDRVIYLAMKAADRYLTAQSVHANNLANANTIGFKAELAAFTDQRLQGSGHQATNNPVYNQTYTDFAPGAIKTTNRALDISIPDQGFIAVQTADGREAYTRSGELEVSATGLLVTSSGEAVLGDGGLIVIPPEQQLSIANDGSISARPSGATADAIIFLDRIKLVNPSLKNLYKATDGLLYTLDGTVVEADAKVRIVQGTLESSNVSMIEEMISMMDMARNFEMQLKLMKTAQEDDAAAANIMRLV